MKALKLTVVLSFLFSLALVAQPSSNTIPEGFIKGSLVTSDNIQQEGFIKNNLRKNGEIIFISADGKKKKYNAAGVSILAIETTHYITIGNAFYKVVTDGSKLRLLRKASQSSGIQYNGSEPILVNAGEGVYDDYFLQTIATGKLQLVRKNDFQKVFAATCADCITLTEELKSNKISFTDIELAVVTYNTCLK